MAASNSTLCELRRYTACEIIALGADVDPQLVRMEYIVENFRYYIVPQEGISLTYDQMKDMDTLFDIVCDLVYYGDLTSYDKEGDALANDVNRMKPYLDTQKKRDEYNRGWYKGMTSDAILSELKVETALMNDRGDILNPAYLFTHKDIVRAFKNYEPEVHDQYFNHANKTWRDTPADAAESVVNADGLEEQPDPFTGLKRSNKYNQYLDAISSEKQKLFFLLYFDCDCSVAKVARRMGNIKHDNADAAIARAVGNVLKKYPKFIDIYKQRPVRHSVRITRPKKFPGNNSALVKEIFK